MTFLEQAHALNAVIQDYFEGIYYGDISKLRKAFYPDAKLYGDIRTVAYEKNLEAYLESVSLRQSPSQLGEVFSMKILGIECLGLHAIAKLHVRMLGYNYYDILSFSYINNQWVIVNKLFTHVEN